MLHFPFLFGLAVALQVLLDIGPRITFVMPSSSSDLKRWLSVGIGVRIALHWQFETLLQSFMRLLSKSLNIPKTKKKVNLKNNQNFSTIPDEWNTSIGIVIVVRKIGYLTGTIPTQIGLMNVLGDL